jgi:hypothetical protein
MLKHILLPQKGHHHITTRGDLRDHRITWLTSRFDGKSPNPVDGLQNWVNQPMYEQNPVEQSTKASGQITFNLLKSHETIIKSH